MENPQQKENLNLSDDGVDRIYHQGKPLVYIIRKKCRPGQTTFYTPPEFKQQVGFVVYPNGGEIKPHLHRDIYRELLGTSEVLVILDGSTQIDIYNDDQVLVATRVLEPGDLVLMVGGGHGFHMQADTTFLEIKQGPYTGIDEKILF
jgi:hypothetical protein